MKLATLILTAAVAVALAAPSTAAVIDLTASMDGPQANAGAGSGSAGTGLGTITYDPDTNTLTWSITWSGLEGTPTLMHFHGPALANQNAGVTVDTGVAGPPVVGNTVITDDQEDDLMAGLWYLNLHTSAHGGGEIRGQVLAPIPTLSKTWGGIKKLFD